MHHPSLQQILERSNSAWKAQHCSMLTSHVPSCQVSTLCCVNWITSFYWKNHARFQITRPSFLTIIFSEVCPKPQILGRMFFSPVAAALLADTLSTSCALKKDTWNCAKQCPKCIAHMFPIVPNKQVFCNRPLADHKICSNHYQYHFEGSGIGSSGEIVEVSNLESGSTLLSWDKVGLLALRQGRRGFNLARPRWADLTPTFTLGILRSTHWTMHSMCNSYHNAKTERDPTKEKVVFKRVFIGKLGTSYEYCLNSWPELQEWWHNIMRFIAMTLWWRLSENLTKLLDL